ncbi:MAG: mechanosensitive ion channel family protein, partial [Pleurocapsa sp.]
NIRARWWVQPPRRAEILDSQDEVLTKLCNRLVDGGIDLNFTTKQILLNDQTEETDGDRAKQREGWPAVKGNNPKPRRIASSLRQLAQSGGNVNGNGKDSRNGQESYS